jgi:hypothetical protein
MLKAFWHVISILPLDAAAVPLSSVFSPFYADCDQEFNTIYLKHARCRKRNILTRHMYFSHAVLLFKIIILEFVHHMKL